MIYLFVTGESSYNRPLQKISTISETEFNEISDLCKLIKSKTKERNWVWGTEIKQTKEKIFVEHRNIIDLYPNVALSTLMKFQEHLPGGISIIKSIQIITGEIKTIF